MKVIRVKTSESESGAVKIDGLAVVRGDKTIDEDPWNTVMNVLRATKKGGSIVTDSTLILDVGYLDVNTLL